MPKFIAGIESVNFNPNSRLAQELEDLFSDVFEFINNSDYAFTPNLGNYDKLYARLCAEWLVNGDYGKRFVRIVQKHCGWHDVCKINTRMMPCVSVFSAPKMPHRDVARAAQDALYRTGDLKIYQDLPGELFSLNRTSKDLLTCWRLIGESFDPVTGKFSISSQKVTEDIQGSISPMVGMPVSLLFLPHPTIDNPIRFTVREITAIYLHEIGHVMDSYVRIANDSLLANIIMYNGKDVVENPKVIKEAPSVEELQGWKEVLTTATNKASAFLSARNESKLLSTLVRQATHVQKLIDGGIYCLNALNDNTKAISADESTEVGVGSALCKILGMLFLGIILLLSSIFSLCLCFGLNWYNQLDQNNPASYLNRHVNASTHTIYRGAKLSEVVASKYTLSISERTADTVAVRFGYGADFASSLVKLSSYSYGAYGIPPSGVTIIDWFGSAITSIVAFLNVWSPITSDTEDVHREGLRRVTSILDEAYKYFRLYKPDNRDEFTRHMMNQIESLRKQVDKAANSYPETAGHKFWEFVWNELLNPAKLIIMLSDADMDADYDKLFSQINTITNNSFHYWSHKFDTDNYNVDSANTV